MNKSYFKCVVCQKQLESCRTSETEKGEDARSPVDGGLHFAAHGCDSSTVFDPSPASDQQTIYLEIVICDPCILALAGNGQVRTYVEETKVSAIVGLPKDQS